MMVLALGQTVWVAVGEADVPLVVERIARAEERPSLDQAQLRVMPAPAPLAMPVQEF